MREKVEEEDTSAGQKSDYDLFRSQFEFFILNLRAEDSYKDDRDQATRFDHDNRRKRGVDDGLVVGVLIDDDDESYSRGFPDGDIDTLFLQ